RENNSWGLFAKLRRPVKNYRYAHSSSSIGFRCSHVFQKKAVVKMKTVNRSLQGGLAVLVLLFWCGAAAAQDIKFNYLPGTDFSKYKTYKWVRIPKADYPNQILDGQIMQAIDAQLALKGLTKTEDANADLY